MTLISSSYTVERKLGSADVTTNFILDRMLGYYEQPFTALPVAGVTMSIATYPPPYANPLSLPYETRPSASGWHVGVVGFGVYTVGTNIQVSTASAERFRMFIAPIDGSSPPPPPPSLSTFDDAPPPIESGGVFVDTYWGVFTPAAWYATVPDQVEYWYVHNTPPQASTNDKPNYRDLVGGYHLDSRTVPNNPVIIPTISTKLKIQYYRWNRDEGIPNLRTIDWMIYEFEIVSGRSVQLPIVDCVLGTLYCSESIISTQVVALSTPSGSYSWGDLFPAAIGTLFSHWLGLWASAESPVTAPSDTVIGSDVVTETSRTIRRSAAYNNIWQNNPTANEDINPSPSHPMFAVDDARAYGWHIAPQSDNSRGTLTMDSPRLIEIHTALNAGKYAINELDHTKPRYTTLGYYIEKIASLLGHRINANGLVDYADEKTNYLRKQLNSPTYTNGEYSLNCFGKRGLIIPHLPTSYDELGRLQEKYDVVYDLPQLLQAQHDQKDKALGIQHGTEIRTIAPDGTIAKYPNQLALLLDLHQMTASTTNRTEKTYTMLTIAAQELRELFAGIGIPTAIKYLAAIDGNGKPTGNRLPYFAYQAGKESILNQLTTVKINLGIIMGTIMPKADNKKSITNPFNFFLSADERQAKK